MSGILYPLSEFRYTSYYYKHMSVISVFTNTGRHVMLQRYCTVIFSTVSASDVLVCCQVSGECRAQVYSAVKLFSSLCLLTLNIIICVSKFVYLSPFHGDFTDRPENVHISIKNTQNVQSSTHQST